MTIELYIRLLPVGPISQTEETRKKTNNNDICDNNKNM